MRSLNGTLKAVAAFAVLFAPCVVFAKDGLPQPRILENPQAIMTHIDQIDDVGDRSRHRADGYGYAHIERLEKYLNDLYDEQKLTLQIPMLRGRVVIVNRSGLYATSSDAGNIYFGVGWANVIDREDEWSALIAHEFSHILLGHHALGSEGKKTAAANALSDIVSGFVKPGAKNRKKVDAFNAKLKSFAEYSDKNLHPSMSRSTEIEADAMAVEILAARGYSFGDGLFAAINRIDANNAQNQDVKDSRTEEIAKQESQKSTKKTTWKDFVREMKETTRKTTADVLRGEGKSHPDTEARLKALAEFIELNFSSYTPTNDGSERWKQIKTSPEVQKQLQSYLFAGEVLDAVISKNGVGLDQKIDRIPALKADIDDSLFSLLAGIYLSRKGRGNDSVATFQRAAMNDAANWIAVEAYYDRSRGNGLKQQQASTLYLLQFERFGRPDQRLPRVIRVLREGGYEQQARQHQMECEQKFPNEKPICAGTNWVGF